MCGMDITCAVSGFTQTEDHNAALDMASLLGKFIVEGIDRLGGALLIPPLTFAQVLIATTDSVMLSSQLDDVDLYRPTLEMYVSVITLP